MLPIYVGYDEREAIAYHVFCNSIIRRASRPVSFCPLSGQQKDGSNSFTYARFLVPSLQGYKGWALFADGDMLCNIDIAELFDQADDSKAVMVVKHDYKTKFPRKYLGNKNEDYPRKNWSSVILWNCGHEANQVLTSDYVRQASGSHLHRFQWLPDHLIGEIKPAYNWLVSEYSYNPSAKILHYTVGTPCFQEYADCDHADQWWAEYEKTRYPI